MLALESSGVQASVAVMRADGSVISLTAESGQSHSSRLLPMAQQLLEQSGLKWPQLDAIVVGVGPGSFTGIRIAVGIAQGLGLGLASGQGVPLIGINGFSAWAYCAWMESGAEITSSLRFDVSFDARLGERYAASLGFFLDNGRITERWLVEPAVIADPQRTVPAVVSRAQDQFILADPDRIADGRFASLAETMLRYVADPRFAHARCTAEELSPLYVRNKVAQTIAERTQVSDLVWRPMTESDVDSVMLIENSAYPYPWTPGNFRDSIHAGYEMSVLRERGVMLGYVVWMNVLDEAHLLNIALIPVRQGRGMGSWMMRHFMDVVRARGLKKIFLEVRPSNVAAIALYRKFGFQQIGVRRGYYPNSVSDAPASREDALMMAIDLNSHGTTNSNATQ